MTHQFQRLAHLRQARQLVRRRFRKPVRQVQKTIVAAQLLRKALGHRVRLRADAAAHAALCRNNRDLHRRGDRDRLRRFGDGSSARHRHHMRVL